MLFNSMKKAGRIRNHQGFTLIEMALVLIIIGIIIGAIVKGRDLIQSAEQKKIFTKYVNAWQTAYLEFYDRTGKILLTRAAPPRPRPFDNPPRSARQQPTRPEPRPKASPTRE